MKPVILITKSGEEYNYRRLVKKFINLPGSELRVTDYVITDGPLSLEFVEIFRETPIELKRILGA